MCDTDINMLLANFVFNGHANLLWKNGRERGVEKNEGLSSENSDEKLILL